MTFKPTDHDEFFQALGAKRVKKALVNHEVRGETERAANVWLEQRDKDTVRRWTIFGVWVAFSVGLLAVGATILAEYIPS